jgi:HSP20 family protein
MATVIRRSEASISLTEKRRDLIHAVNWTVRSSTWSPPTDVYENEDEYIVRVEVAGMNEAGFEVTFEDGFLLISGARPDIPERRAYHQMEIRFGRFSTAISLPGSVDVDASRAEYIDGFLTVSMPKARSTFIEVKE